MRSPMIGYPLRVDESVSVVR
jgi:hypothetical protein